MHIDLIKNELIIEDSLIINGNAKNALSIIPDESIQCVITSPPYWGLRDYQDKEQIGLENNLYEYITNLVGIFEEVKRVLKKDGIFWLNIGDCYTSGNRGWRAADKKNGKRSMKIRPDNPFNIKNKNLIGIPWRLALSLQEKGWYLRSDIIWNKPNCQPESVKDRPTRCHEYIFMFTKSEKYKYFYNESKEKINGRFRNRRTVWDVPTELNRSTIHLAQFPEALIKPCIIASTKENDYILDPFFGSGTVGLMAKHMNRKFIGIELLPEYIELSLNKINIDHSYVYKIRNKIELISTNNLNK